MHNFNPDIFDEINIIRSGDRFEIKTFKDPEIRNVPKSFQKKIKKVRSKDDEDLYFKQSIYRSRRQIENLIYANMNIWPEPNGKILPPTFLTLTFAEHITDLKIANVYFAKFLKKLNYLASAGEKEAFLKYVVVPELTKQKRVHYHIFFFNLRYILKKEIEETWKHGFIKVKKAKDAEHTIEYLLKYVTKESDRVWPKYANRYSASKDLKKPIEIRDNKLAKIFLLTYKEDLIKSMTKSGLYSNKYCGRVEYFVCDFTTDSNLKRDWLAYEDEMIVK